MDPVAYAATVSILLIAKRVKALEDYPQLGELYEKARESGLRPGECARFIDDYVDIVDKKSSLDLAGKKKIINDLIGVSIRDWASLMKIRSGEIVGV